MRARKLGERRKMLQRGGTAWSIIGTRRQVLLAGLGPPTAAPSGEPEWHETDGRRKVAEAKVTGEP
jgi:hypothetical protein